MINPEKIFAAFIAMVILMLIILIPTINYMEGKETEANIAIEERQVKEGTHFTAIVESVDISNDRLIMDNGHQIEASELSTKPVVGDTLSYIQTFDHEPSIWNSHPKETGETTFINIQITE